ncbi:spore coat protein U domain-containing protein [Geminicoccus flavidas]
MAGGGTIPVYGRIPGNQTVPAGNYADTVNVTLTFP